MGASWGPPVPGCGSLIRWWGYITHRRGGQAGGGQGGEGGGGYEGDVGAETHKDVIESESAELRQESEILLTGFLTGWQRGHHEGGLDNFTMLLPSPDGK